MSKLAKVGSAGDTNLISNMILKRARVENDPRLDGLIHASSTTSSTYCPKRFAILDREKKFDLEVEMIPPLTKITFDAGIDKQARINDVYLRDKMIGFWEHPVTGKILGMGHAPDGEEGKHYKYKEVGWRKRNSLLVGRTDALVEITPRDKLLMVEIKIISPNQFKDLAAPLAEHKYRCQLYLHLIANATRQEKSWVNTDYCHVLYCSRAHGIKVNDRMTCFKEYRIKRDDDAIAGVLEKIDVATRNIEKGEFSGAICETNKDKVAQKCPVSELCFGKYGEHGDL